MSPHRDQVTGTVGRVRSRLSGLVRRRVRTVRERSARQAAATTGVTPGPAPIMDPRVAELAFGGGYLVHAVATPEPAVPEGWRTYSLGDRAYHVRTALAPSLTRTGDTLVLLGHPVDVDAGLSDGQVIADRLTAVADAASGDPRAALLRAAARLGGRWTLFLQGADGDLTVLPDALATQQVWFTTDGALLASHETLVPEGVAVRVNSVLEVPSTGAARVQTLDAGPGPEGVTYEQFRARLVEHTRLLAGTGRAGVALTAGTASRAVLAAYLPHRQAEGFTFTHFATESAREGREQAQDLFGASALSHALGVRHRVVRTVAPPRGSVFEVAYGLTSPRGDSAATAFARHHLPPETVELHSAGAHVRDAGSWQAVPDAVRDGDLSHRVALPFNDRRLLEMLVHQPPGQSFVTRLAEELPATE